MYVFGCWDEVILVSCLVGGTGRDVRNDNFLFR
jgi:hypothetical protein